MASCVPKVAQVVPGAFVSIVLKADQRTGREVQGVVRDVLTRGDHHRGIKVRLIDGRIGRVQRMAATAAALPHPGAAANLEGERTSTPAVDGSSLTPRLGESDGAPPPGLLNPGGRRGHRYRDIRSDEPLDAPQEQIDLAAYIVAPKKKKGKGRKAEQDSHANEEGGPSANASGPADISSTTVTCPICGSFEGDETAVAHHVAEHFE
ncbi:hypothetical protein BX600DRAFT_504529 [Xylariales sp. PMI_506]|nr:hypothetical protein BX600DRAFT_504529 [Xylariales sp. PMI_506]